MRILAGDIGGTKTLLQLADVFPNTYKIIIEQSFSSQDYDDFLTLVRQFIKQAATRADLIINSACFGVAGPVSQQVVKTTNLPWRLDAKELSKELGISQVTLINDFEAIGHGIELLHKEDLMQLQSGSEIKHAPRAIIGAGTGLGQGIMIWEKEHYKYIASEGGHTSFAPTNPLQIELLSSLLSKQKQVSNENILSGQGLVAIYTFLKKKGELMESGELRKAFRNADKAAVISDFAINQNDPLASQALDLFCQCYGSQAGNLALNGITRGGVFVAGGIAPKISSKLRDGIFMRAFREKSKMAELLEKMPVYVVLNPKVGLMGAAVLASRTKSM